MPEIDGVRITNGQDDVQKYRLLWEAATRDVRNFKQRAHRAEHRLDRLEKLAEVLEESWPAVAVLVKGALER